MTSVDDWSNDNGALGSWRVTYTPGEWVVLAGPESLVVMPPAPAQAGDFLGRLWENMVPISHLDGFLAELSAAGVTDMPDMAALFWADGQMHSIVRGRLEVLEADSREVLASGEGLRTWNETGLGDQRRVRIAAAQGPTERPEALALPLVVGAAQAEEILVEATDEKLLHYPAPAPVVAEDVPADQQPGADEFRDSGAEQVQEPGADQAHAVGLPVPEARHAQVEDMAHQPEADQPEVDQPVGFQADVDQPVGFQADQAQVGAAQYDGDQYVQAPQDNDIVPGLHEPTDQPQPTDQPAGQWSAAAQGEQSEDAPHWQVYDPMHPESDEHAQPGEQQAYEQQAYEQQPAHDEQQAYEQPEQPAYDEQQAYEQPRYDGQQPASDAGPVQEQTMPMDALDEQPVAPPEAQDYREPEGDGPDAVAQVEPDRMSGAGAAGVAGAAGAAGASSMAGMAHADDDATVRPDAGQPPAPAAPASPVMAMLRPNVGEPVLVDRTVLIGRAPSAGAADAGEEDPALVAVPSPSRDISRTHVKVVPVGRSVQVTDLHSTNGTVLVIAPMGADPETQGQRHQLVPGEPVAVQPGWVLDLGDGATILIDRA